MKSSLQIFFFALVSKKMSKFRVIVFFFFLSLLFVYLSVRLSIVQLCNSHELIAVLLCLVLFLFSWLVLFSSCMDRIEIHDTCCELDTFAVVGSHRKRMVVAFVDRLQMKNK